MAERVSAAPDGRGWCLEPDAFLPYPPLTVREAFEKPLSNGVPLPASAFEGFITDGLAKLYVDGAFFGLGRALEGTVRTVVRYRL